MYSVINGGYTVKLEFVSDLLAHDKANTDLFTTKSYETMHFATYGPFHVGQYKCNVLVLPAYNHLYFYLCFLDNAEAFYKYGIVGLVHGHSDYSDDYWAFLEYGSTKPNKERPFNYSADYLRASGLPVTEAIYGNKDLLNPRVKDDCMVVKFVVWVLLDESKVGQSKPVPQPDPKPYQPSCSSPDFMSELLTGQFSDIHFIIKEQIFTAHTAILAARSSVFCSQLLALQDHETCRNKLHVSIKKMDALIFKYLLHFIYTNSLPSDFDAAPRTYQRMYLAAHRFKVEGLKSICAENLTKDVIDFIENTLENECDQELCLLKIVSKDCKMKPETSNDEE